MRRVPTKTMTWQERYQRLQERLEVPLPQTVAGTSEVARAATALVLGLVMILVGIPLFRGWIGADHAPAWWEFTAGFVLLGASLYVVRWGLLSHERT